MKRLQMWTVLALRVAFGLGLIGFCGDAFHDEVVREARSIPLLIGLAVGVVFGALVVPGLDEATERAGKKGFRMFSLGRRAYDGQAITNELEIPPKADV